MKLVAKKASTGWKAVILSVASALMLVPLTACDEEVRNVMLDGFNQAASITALTLVDAAFQSITADAAAQ